MIAFIALAHGLAWLVCPPLWLGGGLASPLFLPCSVTMMFTSLGSAFLATRFVERTPLRTLGLGAPKPAGRFLGFLAILIASQSEGRFWEEPMLWVVVGLVAVSRRVRSTVHPADAPAVVLETGPGTVLWRAGATGSAAVAPRWRR